MLLSSSDGVTLLLLLPWLAVHCSERAGGIREDTGAGAGQGSEQSDVGPADAADGRKELLRQASGHHSSGAETRPMLVYLVIGFQGCLHWFSFWYSTSCMLTVTPVTIAAFQALRVCRCLRNQYEALQTQEFLRLPLANVKKWEQLGTPAVHFFISPEDSSRPCFSKPSRLNLDSEYLHGPQES